jgi:hypothetical protein
MFLLCHRILIFYEIKKHRKCSFFVYNRKDISVKRFLIVYRGSQRFKENHRVIFYWFAFIDYVTLLTISPSSSLPNYIKIKEMKKCLFFVIMPCFILEVTASGQSNEILKKNVIKTDLILPVAEIWVLAYERIVAPSSSIQFGGLVSNETILFAFDYRYYLSKQLPPHGIYIAPGVLGIIGDNFRPAASFEVGAQALLKNLITLGVSIGPMFILDRGDSFTSIRGGIYVGIAF